MSVKESQEKNLPPPKIITLASPTSKLENPPPNTGSTSVFRTLTTQFVATGLALPSASQAEVQRSNTGFNLATSLGTSIQSPANFTIANNSEPIIKDEKLSVNPVAAQAAAPSIASSQNLVTASTSVEASRTLSNANTNVLSNTNSNVVAQTPASSVATLPAPQVLSRSAPTVTATTTSAFAAPITATNSDTFASVASLPAPQVLARSAPVVTATTATAIAPVTANSSDTFATNIALPAPQILARSAPIVTTTTIAPVTTTTASSIAPVTTTMTSATAPIATTSNTITTNPTTFQASAPEITSFRSTNIAPTNNVTTTTAPLINTNTTITAPTTTTFQTSTPAITSLSTTTGSATTTNPAPTSSITVQPTKAPAPVVMAEAPSDPLILAAIPTTVAVVPMLNSSSSSNSTTANTSTGTSGSNTLTGVVTSRTDSLVSTTTKVASSTPVQPSGVMAPDHLVEFVQPVASIELTVTGKVASAATVDGKTGPIYNASSRFLDGNDQVATVNLEGRTLRIFDPTLGTTGTGFCKDFPIQAGNVLSFFWNDAASSQIMALKYYLVPASTATSPSATTFAQGKDCSSTSDFTDENGLWLIAQEPKTAPTTVTSAPINNDASVITVLEPVQPKFVEPLLTEPLVIDPIKSDALLTPTLTRSVKILP